MFSCRVMPVLSSIFTPENLYLASASQRRHALLGQMGLLAQPYPMDIDESPYDRELPRHYASRMARAKAEAACAVLGAAALGANDQKALVRGEQAKPVVVIAADTVVCAGRRILAKTDDSTQAMRYLRLLSGRRHQVWGGLAVAHWQPEEKIWRMIQRVSLSRVQFCRLNDAEIRAYLTTQQWQGCAGGYAIQGMAGQWVKQLSGSYSNVVGMDMHQLYQIIKNIP